MYNKNNKNNQPENKHSFTKSNEFLSMETLEKTIIIPSNSEEVRMQPQTKSKFCWKFWKSKNDKK